MKLKLLVMCAPFNSVARETEETIEALRMAGASVLKMRATADAALTRCVLAAAGYAILQRDPWIDWVLWLDHDSVCSVGAVEALINYSVTLRDLTTKDERGAFLYPSMSGCYVNRHKKKNPEIAAYKLKNADCVELIDGEPPLVPALVGMGALLQHRVPFMNHCDHAQHFYFPDRNHIVPLVCQSRPIHAAELAQYVDVDGTEESWYWHAEDFDYCCQELDLGQLIYLAPVPIGHVDSIVLLPDEQCVFPGLRQPDSQPTLADIAEKHRTIPGTSLDSELRE